MTSAVSTPPRKHPVLFAAAAIAALLLFALAAPTHWHRACETQDTLNLPLCPAGAATPGDAVQLREHLAHNPGDSFAWLNLLQADKGPQSGGVLAAAATIAPNDVNVLRWRASRALEQGRLADGVADLVRVLQFRGGGKEAQVLAVLVARGDGVALLQPHIALARSWLPQVVAAMTALKLPPGQLLPLVATAMDKDMLPADGRQAYMRALKDSGAWLDAYGLWMASHKQAPLLFNASFDDAFEPDGFDWEFSPVVRSRAGFLLEQEAVARRGHVLDVEFTGKAFPSPVLWQYVFMPPGTYRLRGDYSATSLRSEGGLLWSVQCVEGGKRVIGRSASLADTGGVWKSFEIAFSVPADCGPVARLQLVPGADYEALSGIRGRLAFDNLGLSRTASAEQ